jgi:hypothetical protein
MIIIPFNVGVHVNISVVVVIIVVDVDVDELHKPCMLILSHVGFIYVNISNK